MLIDLDHVRHCYHKQCLLDEVSFTLEEKDKVALVGINGTGKSTLLKLLVGSEACDQGIIRRKKDLRIAYLAQNPDLDDGLSVWDQVMKQTNVTKEYEAKAMLTRLGITDIHAEIATLSGGQRKRVALAQVLLQEYDLLLLDEPTNHLDAEMIEWLEAFLIKSNRAVFMVTHDRYFMERITNRIVELDHGHMFVYQGNYETYLEQKQLRIAQEAQREHKRQRLLKKEWEWVRAGVQARGTKSRDRLARFEALQAESGPMVDQALQLDAPTSRLGKKTVEIHELRKQYQEHVLFHSFSYQMKRCERIGILGPNGCGKSTLLRILAHQEKPDSGSVVLGKTVKIGFFAQHSDIWEPQKCVRDALASITDVDIHRAAQLLEQFGFDHAKQYQKIMTLSGGEQRRLHLLRVLMQAPNILLLDEPTNDLDIDTLQVLEDYLDHFNGGVFVVSHDRYFLDRICDTMFVFQSDGTIQTMIGGYSQSLNMMKQHKKENRQVVKPKHTREVRRSLTSQEKREWEQMETTLATLEKQLQEIDNEMAQTSDYRRQKELGEQRLSLEQQMEERMERWMELEKKRNLTLR